MTTSSTPSWGVSFRSETVLSTYSVSSAYVGDVDDPLFSIVGWGKKLIALWRAAGLQRLPNQPFFLARDKQRPYTYRCGLSDLDMMLKRVGCTETYGLHSLRVLGYNLSKRGNGQALLLHMDFG